MCAGCNNLHPAAAVGIGAIAGFTTWWITELIDRLKIDDPLSAFAVHYGGGVVGTDLKISNIENIKNLNLRKCQIIKI